MDDLTEMLKGTLEGCVLEHRQRGDYGYAITRRLNELGFTDVIEGTVYTILLRLEQQRTRPGDETTVRGGAAAQVLRAQRRGAEELARFWAKWEYVSSRIDRLKEGGR